MENLATKNDDLERTNEHLKEELCSQKVVLEQYKNELMEKDKSNIELTDKLEKVRQNKRKLEKFVKKKMEVIEQISEQRHELEKSLNEIDVKDGQKEDVQKDVRDNKSEEKVVEAEDQDANGRKAGKGAHRDTNNREEEKKLHKETSRDKEKEEKVEEEKKKEEKIAKRTTRKPIIFDLEPEKPKTVISSSDSSHITFQGLKVRATTTRDYGLNGLEVGKLVQFLKTFDRCWNKIQYFSESKSLNPIRGCDGPCGNVPDC
ncbi:golgin subfamily A member 6-like protein 22 [Palaemon carinicauda]|uniref:golgin subfamily A member 6-like protein 22 n=1 Tax=Palaemon carinicauda TaxID=392227 RepID=UPI0035B5C57C